MAATVSRSPDIKQIKTSRLNAGYVSSTKRPSMALLTAIAIYLPLVDPCSALTDWSSPDPTGWF